MSWFDLKADGEKLFAASFYNPMIAYILANAAMAATHKDRHKSGGADAFLLADLLDGVARTIIRRNSGVDVGSRRRLNFIEGTDITLTIADDAVNEELDITIDTSSPLGEVPFDYVFWRDGATYWAKDCRTGGVTSNAVCHTLVNGLLDDRKTYYFRGHTFDLTGAINLRNYMGVTICGNPMRGTNFTPADTINAFEFDENWWCVLKDFFIDGSLQVTSGMGIMYTEATAINYAYRNLVKNIEFSGCYIGIGDRFTLPVGTNGSSSQVFQDLTFTDCTYSDVKLYVSGTGGWVFQNIGINHNAVQCTDAFSFSMIGADGLLMKLVSLQMGGATSFGGALIEDTDFIWMDNCDIEKAGLTSWDFKNCRFGLFSNMRVHECGVTPASAGEALMRLQGCREFSFTNSSLNIAYQAGNSCLRIFADGATESDHITFVGGHITNSAGYGAVLSDNTSNIKFNDINFYGNANDDIFEEDATNYNTYKINNMNSGNGWTLIGARNTYDVYLMSVELDLSGGAVDPSTFFSATDCVLVGYRIIYTEAASANAGVEIRIGKYRTGVALDDDYFDDSTSIPNRGLGDEDFFNSATLTNQSILSGDILTVGTAGGKVGLGNVKLILSIMENCS